VDEETLIEFYSAEPSEAMLCKRKLVLKMVQKQTALQGIF